MTNMQVKLGTTTLRNPVVLASGTCGVLGEISDAINVSTIGALTSKSITKEPQEGNDPIRMYELPRGMINAIGLANKGIESFIQDYAKKASLLDTMIIGSVAGDTIENYVSVAQAMDQIEGIDLVEINVSCPNTLDGLEFGACPKQLATLLSEIRPVLSRCGMIVKLSVAPGDIRPHAEAAISCGADALTLINTIPAITIDVETRESNISIETGGMSGQAIHPIAVRVVREVYRDVARNAGIPIIGTGGIMHWRDAAEFIIAGATAVGIGTALFVNPAIAPQIAKKLATWVDQQGCSSVGELVGAMSER